MHSIFVRKGGLKTILQISPPVIAKPKISSWRSYDFSTLRRNSALGQSSFKVNFLSQTKPKILFADTSANATSHFKSFHTCHINLKDESSEATPKLKENVLIQIQLTQEDLSGLKDPPKIKWLVSEGDHVKEFGPLCQLQNGVTFKSRVKGVVKKLYFSDGEVPLNTPLVDIAIEFDEPIPIPALVLGYMGLLPFVTTAAVSIMSLDPVVSGYFAFLQLTYAASVLSFMGATHWGLAVAKYSRNPNLELADGTQSMRYGVGIIPSLLGWLALTQDPLTATITLLSGYTGLFLFDVYADKKGLVPSWYLKLRFPLTMGVITCLGIMFIQLYQ